MHLLHREPFEALALPLTLLNEEVGGDAAAVMALILNRTRLNFAGKYLLLVEVNTRKNKNTSYKLEIHLTGANTTEISENGTFSYILEKVFRLKFSTPRFFIRGKLELHPYDPFSRPDVAVYLLKRIGNDSYMRVGCADFTEVWNGSYRFDVNPRYDYWSHSIRPTATALLWMRLAGDKEMEGSFLKKTPNGGHISGACESYLAGARACTEDYAMLLLLLDLHDGSFTGGLPETETATPSETPSGTSENDWLRLMSGLAAGFLLGYLLGKRR